MVHKNLSALGRRKKPTTTTKISQKNKQQELVNVRASIRTLSRREKKDEKQTSEIHHRCMNYYLRPNSHSIPHVMSIISLFSSPKHIWSHNFWSSFLRCVFFLSCSFAARFDLPLLFAIVDSGSFTLVPPCFAFQLASSSSAQIRVLHLASLISNSKMLQTQINNAGESK